MKANDPRATPPNTTARDALVAGLLGLLVLGFIIAGVISFMQQAQRTKANTLNGEVVGKQFTPAPEQQIQVGSKGLKSERIAGEYVLVVFVDEEKREFEVPVDQARYDATRVGDKVSFLRPRSEQQR